MKKEEEQKIQQLQLMEQSMQNLLMQKQNFQAQHMEIDSALDELEKTNSAYKIVGNIMVSAEKSELKEDLKKKREIVDIRIKSIEKQEAHIREKATKLQEEVLQKLKKEG